MAKCITITVEMNDRPPQTIPAGADSFTFHTGHIKTFDYADRLLGEIRSWITVVVAGRIADSKPDNTFLRAVNKS